jgi:hypothetical protein
MKKMFRIAAVALVIGGISFSSCKKYEEGPALSLLSKKARIAGTWKVEAYLENGVDKTSDYRQLVTDETYTTTKEGTYTSSQTTVLGTFSDNGTWELINDKADFKTLSAQSGSTPDTMVIVKLKSKEFWMKSKSGNPVVEIHYMPR